MKSELKSSRTAPLAVLVLAAALSLAMLAGCAQSEPSAGDMEKGSATPSSGSTSAAVAESSDVNDMADGIATVEVTPELEALTSASDVKDYVAELQQKTDELAGVYDSENESYVNDANYLLEEIANLNHYLPTLVKDNVITEDDANGYSEQMDDMLLQLDALVAA